MKKTIIIGLAFLFFSNVLGQKKELKNIEKLIKTENFELAFTELGKVKDLISSSDNKIKSKYHYLRGLLFFNDTLTVRFESLSKSHFRQALQETVQIQVVNAPKGIHWPFLSLRDALKAKFLVLLSSLL